MVFPLSIERGNSYLIAVKGIFAISLTILIFKGTFVDLITESLSIVIIISGIILSILSLLRPIEWSLKKFISEEYDKNLPKGSIGFWKTINEPQWELFRNNVIGDIYLILVFIIVFIKILLNKSFVDFSELENFHFPDIVSLLQPYFPGLNTVPLIISISDVILLVIVCVRLNRRVSKNRINIILSQYFLSLKNSDGVVDQKLETYFLNKQWFLFRTFYRKYHKSILSNLKAKRRELRAYLKTPNPIDALGNYARIFREIANNIKEKRLQYHCRFKLKKYHTILTEFELQIRILLIFYHLIKGKVSNAESLFSRSMNEWVLVGPHDDEHLSNALETLPFRVKKELSIDFNDLIDSKWINTVYENFDDYIRILDNTIQEIDEFITQELREK